MLFLQHQQYHYLMSGAEMGCLAHGVLCPSETGFGDLPIAIDLTFWELYFRGSDRRCILLLVESSSERLLQDTSLCTSRSAS